MNSNSTFINKLNHIVSRFSNNIFVKSIANGMMMILPITLVGSFAMIINMIPGLPTVVRAACTLGTTVASNLIAIWIVVALSYAMSQTRQTDAIPAVILSLACYFVLTPIATFNPNSDKPISAFDLSYLGSKGIFVSMFIALLVTYLFGKMVEKRITFRMPASVPPSIAKQFEAMIPAAALFAVAVVISSLFQATKYGNIHDFIYTTLQAPLQTLGGSIWTVLLIMFLSELLWWFGIHGSMVTASIIAVLFTPAAYENMEAVTNGGAATHIINSFFLDTYKGPRALALAVLLLWFCRSERLKSVGKVAIVPSLFGITEPMKFGIPQIMNLTLFIPLTLSAALSIGIAYIASIIGFLPPVSIAVAKNLPPVFTGFLSNGWQGAVVQVIQFFAVVALYYPFLKHLDAMDIAEEAELAKEEGNFIETITDKSQSVKH